MSYKTAIDTLELTKKIQLEIYQDGSVLASGGFPYNALLSLK